MIRTVAVLVVSMATALVAGCTKPVHFPADPTAAPAGLRAYRAFDTNGNGKADFFLFAGDGERVRRIGYDFDADGTIDQTADLDAVDLAQSRHLVIILDGFSHDLVRKYYDEGNLRVFHRPSRVVAPYPTLTDPAMTDILGSAPVAGFEAEYFDHRANGTVGGSGAYLRGENQPYNRLMQYRADLILDAIGYVKPWAVFGKEVNDTKRLFDTRKSKELIAYLVSSAGVGTQRGAEGQRMCLKRVEQLVHQVLWETRGLTKVTLLADHGHSYTPATRIDIEGHLKAKGWRVTDRLAGPRDVAYIRFGLETYASFATRSGASLAGDLIELAGVELASFAEDGAVIVLGRDGTKATIRRNGRGFKYEPAKGDPLKLKGILARLPAGKDGYHDANFLLAATGKHEYPAPLQRIWRAHFALVENPPDVIVSLADEFYSGSSSFGGMVKVVSTHGGLNRGNSVTFIMSTAGELPPLMRSREIRGHLRALFGRRWPMRE